MAGPYPIRSRDALLLRRGPMDATRWHLDRSAVYLTAGVLTFLPEWLLIAVRYAPEGLAAYGSYLWRAVALAAVPLGALLLLEATIRHTLPAQWRSNVARTVGRGLRSPIGALAVNATVFAMLFTVLWALIVTFWIDLDLPTFFPMVAWQRQARTLHLAIPITAVLGANLGLAIALLDRIVRRGRDPWYCSHWSTFGLPVAFAGALVLPTRVVGFWSAFHPVVSKLTFAGFVVALATSPFWGRPLSRLSHRTVFRMLAGTAGIGLVLLASRLGGITDGPLRLLDANRPFAVWAASRFNPPAHAPGYSCPERAQPTAVAGRPEKDLILVSMEALAPNHVLPDDRAGPAPTIARIAETGVTFERAMSPGPRTAFGTVALVLGRSMQCTDPLPNPREPNLFRVLADVDYQTGHVGSLSLGVADYTVVPHARALEASVDHLAYVLDDPLNSMTEPVDADAATMAVEWLEQAEPSRPIALWVHFMNPHHPYNPPAGFLGTRGSGRVARYEEEIAATDHELDRLLAAADRLRPHTEKLVVLAGDHGQSMRKLGPRYHASDVIADMVHTVLVIQDPSLGPRAISDMVSLIDVPATVLDLLGLEHPESFQGRSLRPLMEGGTLPDIPIRLDNALWRTQSEAVVMGKYKLIRWLRPRYEGIYPRPEILQLYDVEADPAERRNLVHAAPAVVDELYGLLPREYYDHAPWRW